MRFDLSVATAVHVERETARQGEISSLHAVGEALDVQLTDLYGRFDLQRRVAADMQEMADKRALRVKEQINHSQVRSCCI